MASSKKPSSKTKKAIISIVVIVVLILLGFLLYKELNHKKAVTNSSSKNTFHIAPGHSKPTKHQIVKTPSLSTSNTNNTSTQSNSTLNSNINTNPSLYKTSSSGLITLHTPYNNETIESGFPINGTAKVPQVNYILIDNEVGQIAQGSLKVINGKFQGTLNFTPHAASGVLQVYSPNPTNGAEENIINIDINY
jgi:cytoskeletal protein RodZ